MPTLSDITKKRENKNFKKREYRPWNIEGLSTSSPNITHSTSVDNNITDDMILNVSPNEVLNWELHDRPENELGNIEALSEEFKVIGQQQPCIVRLLSLENNGYKYELIVGERRWKAAAKAGIPVKIVIRNLTDAEAAIIQASENLSRKNLSDYARGMSYAKLIEKGIISQKELGEKLNISKQQMSRLLSFSKLPQQLTAIIKDFSKISARTAEQIKQLTNKGNQYIEAIIHFADQLRDGKIGHEKLNLLIDKHLHSYIKYKSNKIFTSKGQHIFTWHQDNNVFISLHFSKNIGVLLKLNQEVIIQINNKLTEILEYLLSELNE